MFSKIYVQIDYYNQNLILLCINSYLVIPIVWYRLVTIKSSEKKPPRFSQMTNLAAHQTLNISLT